MTSIPFGARQTSPGPAIPLPAIPSPAVTALLRASMILAFDLAPVEDWSEIVTLAVIAHGGSLTLPPDPTHPRRGDSWESHMAELSLIGITGRGGDLESAVRDWCKAAGRTLGVGEAA